MTPDRPDIPYLMFYVQVGFGKGTASKQLWIDGIDPTMSEAQLERHMSKYGQVHYTFTVYTRISISNLAVEKLLCMCTLYL